MTQLSIFSPWWKLLVMGVFMEASMGFFWFLCCKYEWIQYWSELYNNLTILWFQAKLSVTAVSCPTIVIHDEVCPICPEGSCLSQHRTEGHSSSGDHCGDSPDIYVLVTLTCTSLNPTGVRMLSTLCAGLLDPDPPTPLPLKGTWHCVSHQRCGKGWAPKHISHRWTALAKHLPWCWLSLGMIICQPKSLLLRKLSTRKSHARQTGSSSLVQSFSSCHWDTEVTEATSE